MYKIFSKPGCPWCVKAKDLLTSYNIAYQEESFDNPEKIATFKQDYQTFPQVFNEKGQNIGGYEALEQYLEQKFPEIDNF